jgi:hypothetical protein
MAGLVPAAPIVLHGRAKYIRVAGTSPAMTAGWRSTKHQI